jgi:hypothetical protein
VTHKPVNHNNKGRLFLIAIPPVPKRVQGSLLCAGAIWND